MLFVTTFAAAFIWLWGVGGYYILKWFNKKEIPGINAPLPEGMSLEDFAVKAQGGQENEKDSTVDYHANGDAKHHHHSSSKETTRSSDQHRTTHRDDDRRKSGNVVGTTVNKVPGGSKVTDTTKAIGVDLNRDPTKDPHKVVDVGKVTSGGREKVGDVGGKVGDVVGKVPVAGKVKGVAGGLLG